MRMLILSAVGVLAGCTGLGGVSHSLQSPAKVIATFTIDDLKNADALAKAQTPPDLLADRCFSGLIEFLEAQQNASIAPRAVRGGFSAFEAVRVSVNKAENLISKTQLENLEIACGPLIIDVQNQSAAFLAAIAAIGAK